MLDKHEYELFKSYLENTWDKLGGMSPNLWYANDDNMLTVAQILNYYEEFPDTNSVIYFFEKPYKWESRMKEMVEEYEKEYNEKTPTT